MNYDLDPRVMAILRCPHCRQELVRSSDGRFSCRSCDALYGWSKTGSLDLRLRKPKPVELRFDIAPSHHLTEIPWHEELPANPTPSVDFGDTRPPIHLSKALMSYFPRAAGKDSLMLDLGCGDTVHRQVCERAGFFYVGVDIDNPKAQYLADAHALPFRDDSFDFLLSISVLEHIQFPFVVAREAYRVLRPGGLFVGSAAFLEPFHGNSFYHQSRLGILNTLLYGGFEILQVAASTTWTVFKAQAHMEAADYFPRTPRVLSSNLILLPQIMSRLWWRVGLLLKPNLRSARSSLTERNAGAFYFVAKKADT